jgi:hypothetical protein
VALCSKPAVLALIVMSIRLPRGIGTIGEQVMTGNVTASPGVALVVGAVMALESGAEMHFDNGGVCLFLLGANVPPNGYIKFGVANFHYDPIIQVHG